MLEKAWLRGCKAAEASPMRVIPNPMQGLAMPIAPAGPIAQRLAVLGLAVLLSACARSPHYVPLAEADSAALTTASVVHVQMQDRLGWSYVAAEAPATYSPFLLADLLIDLVAAGVTAGMTANRRDEAETLSAPARAAFDAEGFQNGLHAGLPAVFAAAAWLPAPAITRAAPFNDPLPGLEVGFTVNGAPARENEDTILADLRAQAGGDARGVLQVNYALGPTFAEIIFVAELTFHAADKAGADDAPIYRTRQRVTHRAPGTSEDPEFNARLWLENDGEALERAKTEGLRDLLAALKVDIANPRQNRQD